MRDFAYVSNRHDQAGELRKMVKDNNAVKTPRLHTLAVLSGKGGVGKSNIAAGISFALADFGKRVVLIDADLGMANLDILCGVRNAKWNISHLIEGSRSLSEVLVHFRVSARAEKLNGGVALLPGGVGLREIADMAESELERFFASLSGLDETADYVIMDAGAGIHKGALSFADYDPRAYEHKRRLRSDKITWSRSLGRFSGRKRFNACSKHGRQFPRGF